MRPRRRKEFRAHVFASVLQPLPPSQSITAPPVPLCNQLNLLPDRLMELPPLTSRHVRPSLFRCSRVFTVSERTTALSPSHSFPGPTLEPRHVPTASVNRLQRTGSTFSPARKPTKGLLELDPFASLPPPKHPSISSILPRSFPSQLPSFHPLSAGVHRSPNSGFPRPTRIFSRHSAVALPTQTSTFTFFPPPLASYLLLSFPLPMILAVDSISAASRTYDRPTPIIAAYFSLELFTFLSLVPLFWTFVSGRVKRDATISSLVAVFMVVSVGMSIM